MFTVVFKIISYDVDVLETNDSKQTNFNAIVDTFMKTIV